PAVAGPLLEVRRGPGGDGPAVIDGHDLARKVVGLVKVLGGEHDVGPVIHQFPDGVPELDARPGVETGGGLVEQKDPWLADEAGAQVQLAPDRKSTRLNSSHVAISYAVFCLKKKINSKSIV